MKSHFTTREVAKILHLPEWRVRSCVRAGFLTPKRGRRGECQFAFQDLLVLRTTKGLMQAHVPLKRIRGILHSLRRQLPPDHQLSNLKIYADGRRVVAWDGSARWQPDSGQFLFNFEAQEVAERVDLPRVAKNAQSNLAAEQWFDVAAELEKTSLAEARRAYHQALELDPTLGCAHINVGRLYHQAGEFREAEAHYREAIECDPGDALAHFNLGVLLEDMGRPEAAMRAYGQALKCDPNSADAHYNLALLFEAQGRRSEAIKHFRVARKCYNPIGRGEN
jgi:tetratricopeptide (TPR) repeat protein